MERRREVWKGANLRGQLDRPHLAFSHLSRKSLHWYPGWYRLEKASGPHPGRGDEVGGEERDKVMGQ
jgi:hypothetical protein